MQARETLRKTWPASWMCGGQAAPDSSLGVSLRRNHPCQVHTCSFGGCLHATWNPSLTTSSSFCSCAVDASCGSFRGQLSDLMLGDKLAGCWCLVLALSYSAPLSVLQESVVQFHHIFEGRLFEQLRQGCFGLWLQQRMYTNRALPPSRLFGTVVAIIILVLACSIAPVTGIKSLARQVQRRSGRKCKEATAATTSHVAKGLRHKVKYQASSSLPRTALLGLRGEPRSLTRAEASFGPATGDCQEGLAPTHQRQAFAPVPRRRVFGKVQQLSEAMPLQSSEDEQCSAPAASTDSAVTTLLKRPRLFSEFLVPALRH